MSEYQYYEFQAIDRPLTEAQMGELRSVSTRARITPTSFVNHYQWGDFKGSPDAWMEKYFDAFLYFANWGSRSFMLRLPARILDLDTARQYCSHDSASARQKGDKVILTFSSDDEWGDGEWLEGEDLLSSLTAVRAELARGDLRALYLGWLRSAWVGEREDGETEPPVPPGLGQLSASLENLAEFLRLDEDLLSVAAQASAPLGDTALRPDEVHAWIATLPTSEKDAILTRLLAEDDQTLVAELQRRFLESRPRVPDAASPPRRTIGELIRAAEAHQLERQRREAERRAQEQASREREASLAREKHLDTLVGREAKLWSKVEDLVATKRPKEYAQSIEILIDLRDLAARTEDVDFQLRLETLRQSHDRKPAFIERLRKAGL